MEGRPEHPRHPAEAKYVITWIEMKQELLNAYHQGKEVNPDEVATTYTEEVAESLEKLTELLEKRLDNLETLATWGENKIKYPS